MNWTVLMGLGVKISWRALAAYWLGLLIVASYIVLLVLAYHRLEEAVPWAFAGGRRSSSIAIGLVTGLFLVGMLKFGMPLLLRICGAPVIDHIGYRRASGDERVVPDYPSYRQAKRRNLDDD